MIIRVLDRNYFVQQTISSDNGLVQYVCTNVAEDDGRVCRIVRIPLPEVDTGLIRYLSDIYKAGSFRELVQYANEGGYMQVVTDCGAQNITTRRVLFKPESQRVVVGQTKNKKGKVVQKYVIVKTLVKDVVFEETYDTSLQPDEPASGGEGGNG